MYPVPVKKDYIGHTEDFIGNWLTARGNRKDIILATKVCIT